MNNSGWFTQKAYTNCKKGHSCNVFFDFRFLYRDNTLLFKYIILFIVLNLGSFIYAFSQIQIGKKEKIIIKPCEFVFSGHLGEYTNKISNKRINDLSCWNRIYPETEEAFRLREDDINYPNNGKWRGEFWGRYILSAIASSEYYHSKDLKERIREAVNGLLTTQDESGYMGTYAHSGFLIGDTWNIWGRKYTLWALIEAYNLLHDPDILAATRKFADHIISEAGPGSTDIVLSGNFYGMASTSILYPMLKLYNITGEVKYLEYSHYIVDQWTKHPEGLPDILNKGLEGIPVHEWFPNNDPYQWAKGSELISCIEGIAELYYVTGEKKYLIAAENAYESLVKWERTPVGSLGFNDKYVGAVGLINTLSELCDVIYWNRLSFKLFSLTGKEKYIEEFERSLYNSVLCAFNSEGTWGIRRLRMSHIHVPAQNHFLQHHQCCVENIPRGLFQAAEAVLTARKGDIYLSLFNEGEGIADLSSGSKLKIKLEGDFLKYPEIKAKISLSKKEKFNLYIRMPGWSNKTSIKINGKLYKGKPKDSWLSVKRKWNNGDVIDITFNVEVRWELFDRQLFTNSFHDIQFYENEWANFKYAGGSNEEIIRKYSHVSGLPVEEALPHRNAVTFFYGPLVLSRDVRLTEGDIFSSIDFSPVRDKPEIRSVFPPKGIWKAFELKLGKGEKIKFCDFSSAGNTWNEDSKFNTWCILQED